MANPQLENGYVKIANEIMEALAGIRISGEENQCLFVILRKTYGWNKREDAIAISQFASLTGLKRPGVVRAINNLLKKQLIIKNDKGEINKYKLNKDFHQWQPLSKKITGYIKKSILRKYCYVCEFVDALVKHHLKPQSQGGSDRVFNLINLCPNCHALVHKGKISEETLLSKKITHEIGLDGTQSIIKNDNELENKGLSKKINTKDTITKDTITKESEEEIWVLPSSIDPKIWNEFEQHRKEIREPLTDLARTKASNAIKDLSVSDQRATVDKTIQSRWAGLFPPKNAKPQESSVKQKLREMELEGR